MASSTSSIADKIQNDFLICKICLNTFKQPKMLPCLHTYCQGCLESLAKNDWKIQCPECRELVCLSGGVSQLKTNFHINSLLDLFQSPEVRCSLCPPGRQSKSSAVLKCVSCSNHMCQTCGDSHRSAYPGHRVVGQAGATLGADDAETLMAMKQTVCCQSHPKDRVAYYCNTCERVICHKCYSRSCNRHKRLGLTEAAEAKKPALRKLLERLASDIQLTVRREGELDEAMERFKAIECSIMSNIEDTLTQVLNDLFKQGDAIKKAVSNHVKKQEELCEAAKATLQLQKKKAESTREFGARILTASDVKEILCLQSIVEDQISALQALGSQELNKASPKVTVNKSIKDLISRSHLFSITFGDESVCGSQLNPLTEQWKLTPANLPAAPPREMAVQKYSFDTKLDCDFCDPKLTGVSTSQDGDIIVVDEKNSVLKYFLDDGSLKMTIPMDEEDDPCGVAVCGDVIACSVKHRLHFLEMDGSLLRKLLLRGSESVYPIAAFEDEYVAVSEGTLCSISLYNPDGHVVDRVKPRGYEGIRFLFIAINSEEKFIVSDSGKKCVLIFNRDEEVFTVITQSFLNGLECNLNPFSVCVDAEDNIYVTEPSRILLFSSTGVFKQQLLNVADGLYKPRVITVDQDNNLIITQSNGFVCVYRLFLQAPWVGFGDMNLAQAEGISLI